MNNIPTVHNKLGKSTVETGYEIEFLYTSAVATVTQETHIARVGYVATEPEKLYKVQVVCLCATVC